MLQVLRERDAHLYLRLCIHFDQHASSALLPVAGVGAIPDANADVIVARTTVIMADGGPKVTLKRAPCGGEISMVRDVLLA